MMFKFPLQLLGDISIKDKSWHNAPNLSKPLFGWILAYLLMLLVCELPELSLCASVAGSKVKHEGFCPNKLNSNLWVDAQSTCERECNVDEVVLFKLSPLVFLSVHFVILFVHKCFFLCVLAGLRRL